MGSPASSKREPVYADAQRAPLVGAVTVGPYRAFVQDQYKTLSLTLPPGSSSADTMKALSALWRGIPKEDRQQYKEAAIRKQEAARKRVLVSEWSRLDYPTRSIKRMEPIHRM